jgi:hypothetical protein
MKLTNITDHPSKLSQIIKVQGGEVKPGQTIEVPYDVKLEGMSELIALEGKFPLWYSQWKADKEVKVEDLIARFSDPVVAPVKETPTKKK